MKNIFSRISNFPKDYLLEVESTYLKCKSVQNITQWYNNLDKLSISVANKKSSYRHVENLLFELKVMNFIIDISEYSQITYEPKGDVGKGKSCDLLVEADETYLIELKSFHPSNKSTPIPYEYIAENNEVIMDRESYHSFQAVRGHLIDETFNTENKIKNYGGDYKNILGILLGFYVDLEDLRDFFTIYKKGGYRFDDSLGKMTMHKIGDKSFIGNIDEFWGFPFQQFGFDFKGGEKAVSLSITQGKDTEIKI